MILVAHGSSSMEEQCGSGHGAFKLIESAQSRWRAVNALHLAALVRAGATFTGGKLAERPEDLYQPDAA